ncbi:MAG: EamA family transporter RarD [Clostridia bacterium]|nr:EamA family transporter RarD [Clostridia bacterium]
MQDIEKDKKSKDYNLGLTLGLLCYFIWGILPAYWKLGKHISSLAVLSHRVIWSFVFVSLLLFIMKEHKNLIEPIRDKKNIISLILASVIISINWGTYIWAIVSGHMIEASMGYYINPLIVSLFSVIFFKEKMTKVKLISVMLAFSGVFIMIYQYHKIPYVALTLAISFACYGVIKKRLQMSAFVSLFYETLFLLPIALGYSLYIETVNESIFLSSAGNVLFLMGAGIVTSVPLLLFAASAKRIHFSTLGFMQYLAPTMTLLMGVLIYLEPFKTSHFITFGLIWMGLIVYSMPHIITIYNKNHS